MHLVIDNSTRFFTVVGAPYILSGILDVVRGPMRFAASDRTYLAKCHGHATRLVAARRSLTAPSRRPTHITLVGEYGIRNGFG